MRPGLQRRELALRGERERGVPGPECSRRRRKASTNGNDVKAQALEAFGAGGMVTNLGGGCGAGGFGYTTGVAAAGNTQFALQLAGADPVTTFAFLNLRIGPPLAVPCGPCAVLLPQWIFAVQVQNGSGSIPLPLPCNAGLVGAGIGAQWLVPKQPTQPGPCPYGYFFSNVLHTTIGQ